MANDRHPVHITIFDRSGRKKITAYDDSMWGWPNEEGVTDYVMSYPAKKYPDHIVEVMAYSEKSRGDLPLTAGSLTWRFRTGRVAGQTSARLLRKSRSAMTLEAKVHHATKKKSAAQLDREIAEMLSGWGVGGGASLTEDRVAKLTDDHINEIYRDAQARGDTKTAKLAAKAAYAYDRPGEKIAALASHLAGKSRRVSGRRSHATTKKQAKQIIEPLPHNRRWHDYIVGQGGELVTRYKGQDIHRNGFAYYVNGLYVGNSMRRAKEYVQNTVQ